MSNTISIATAKREICGSAVSRRLRNAGIIPGVIYSCGAETQMLQISFDDAKKIARHTGLIELNYEDGSKKNAIIKEMQLNPLTGKPLCVDFLEVKAGEKVTLSIPVESFGEAEGIRQGGQLEQVVRFIEVTGEPANIPEVLKVDVSALERGKALTIADLKAEGLEIAGDKQIVFHVR